MDCLIKVPQILIHSGICDDYTILSDNGHFAQQDIKHLHFHVIPRHMNEKFEFKLNTDFTAAEKSNLLSVWRKITGRWWEKIVLEFKNGKMIWYDLVQVLLNSSFRPEILSFVV